MECVIAPIRHTHFIYFNFKILNLDYKIRKYESKLAFYKNMQRGGDADLIDKLKHCLGDDLSPDTIEGDFEGDFDGYFKGDFDGHPLFPFLTIFSPNHLSNNSFCSDCFN